MQKLMGDEGWGGGGGLVFLYWPQVSVTRESNFVEVNVCVWCVFTSSRLPVPVDSVTECPTQQFKYVNRNALSMFKALNKSCK